MRIPQRRGTEGVRVAVAHVVQRVPVHVAKGPQMVGVATHSLTGRQSFAPCRAGTRRIPPGSLTHSAAGWQPPLPKPTHSLRSAQVPFAKVNPVAHTQR